MKPGLPAVLGAPALHRAAAQATRTAATAASAPTALQITDVRCKNGRATAVAVASGIDRVVLLVARRFTCEDGAITFRCALPRTVMLMKALWETSSGLPLASKWFSLMGTAYAETAVLAGVPSGRDVRRGLIDSVPAACVVLIEVLGLAAPAARLLSSRAD